jgi:hypothetical protein
VWVKKIDIKNTVGYSSIGLVSCLVCVSYLLVVEMLLVSFFVCFEVVLLGW